MEMMASKLARSVWFDESISLDEKVLQMEMMGDAFAKLSQNKGLKYFAMVAQVLYAELAGRLSTDGNVQDIIRVREKQFQTMKDLMKLVKKDGVLKECVKKTFQTEDILAWQVTYLLESQHVKFVKLRECPEYVRMLLSWKES